MSQPVLMLLQDLVDCVVYLSRSKTAPGRLVGDAGDPSGEEKKPAAGGGDADP